MPRIFAAIITASVLLTPLALRQVAYAGPPTGDAAPATKKSDTPKEKLPTQATLASKTATFATVAATATEVKGAMDAHDLAKAKTMEGKPVTFVGMVAKVYDPKSNKIVIVNFDKDFKSALTAVVFDTDFAKFPDLKTLDGKKICVSGTVKSFHESEEVVLNKPEQVKVVK